MTDMMIVDDLRYQDQMYRKDRPWVHLDPDNPSQIQKYHHQDCQIRVEKVGEEVPNRKISPLSLSKESIYDSLLWWE